uniref:Uncharacterized protein n=1 Tax=Timema douglasi TaxID=61478 RepID=A0A7R8VKT2_TIMDO|nr:unnamed protein product [Timema douglasi]
MFGKFVMKPVTPFSNELTSEVVGVDDVCICQEAATDVKLSLKNLHCFLQIKISQTCDEIEGLPEPPQRLLDLYQNFTNGKPEAVNVNLLENLSPEQTSLLPAFFIHLTPVHRFTINGKSLGYLIRSNDGDVSLLLKIVPLLSDKWDDFFSEASDLFNNSLKRELLNIQCQELQHLDLSPSFQETLARSLSMVEKDFGHDIFDWTIKIGTPLLAYFPANYLTSLDVKTASKFLYYLRTWHWEGKQSGALWSNNPWRVKRVWSYIAIAHNYTNNISTWSTQDIKSFGFFLEGATADELNMLQTWDLSTDNLKSARWNKLQSRVLFTRLFRGATLTSANLDTVLPLALKLSPRNLQRFVINQTDFRLLLTLPPDHREGSLITANQVVQSLIAQLVLSGRLVGVEPALWKENITYLGHYVHALPPHALQPYISFPLSDTVLRVIDSDKITSTQARFLTGGGSFVQMRKPETLLALKGLLKVVSSSTLALASSGELQQRVKSHMLANLPQGSLVRSTAVLQKVRSAIGDRAILDDMLSNKQPEQFFSLLSSMEVTSVAERMMKSLQALQKDFGAAIRRLPRNVLSPLLSAARRKLTSKGSLWNTDTLLLSEPVVAILGLSCNDILAIETTDLIPILERYNREGILAKQVFPKNLQYCVQTAVLKYLKLKSELQGWSEVGGLLDVLEVPEIQAVGGYVLASFPESYIDKAPSRRDILESIGQLTLPELLLATSGKNPKAFSNIALKHLTDGLAGASLGLKELLSLGNLALFLEPLAVEGIDPAAFKLWLELETVSRTVCMPSSAREAWFKLVKRAFGPSNTWSETTLSTLGDFLACVPGAQLDEVPVQSWVAAADTLADQTGYHSEMEWLGVEGKLMVVEVCAQHILLGQREQELYNTAVRGLIRHYLLAAQGLMSTVHSASFLISQSTQVQSFGRRLVPLERPSMAVEVLEIEEELTPQPGSTPRIKTVTKAVTKDKMNIESSIKTSVNSTVLHLADGNLQIPSTVATSEFTRGYGAQNSFLVSVVSPLTAGEPTSGLTLKGEIVEKNTQVNDLTEVNQDGVSTTGKEQVQQVEEDGRKEDARNVGGRWEAKRKIQGQVDWAGVEEERWREDRTNVNMPRSKRDHGSVLRSKVKTTTGRGQFSEPVGLSSTTSLPSMTSGQETKISCEVMKAVGPSAGLAVTEQDLELLTLAELEDCVDALAALKLPLGLKKKVWDLARKSNLTLNIADLGALLEAVEEQDLKKLNFSQFNPSSLDTLFALSSHVTETHLLEIIRDQFISANLHSLNVDISTETLVALGRVVCLLSVPFLRQLVGETDAVLQVSAILGGIGECNGVLLGELATQVFSKQANVPSRNWTADDFTSLGVIVAGMSVDQWGHVDASSYDNPMFGLQPAAVKRIDLETFKELTLDHLASLSPMAAAMVSEAQLASLNESQQLTLMRVRNMEPAIDTALEVDSVAAATTATSKFGKAIIDMTSHWNGEGIIDMTSHWNGEGIIDMTSHWNGEGIIDMTSHWNGEGIIDMTSNWNGEGIIDMTSNWNGEGIIDMTSHWNEEGIIDMTSHWNRKESSI